MSLKYMFSKAIRSFERFAAEFAGVASRVCAIACLQFVIVLLHGGGVSVVVVIHGNGDGSRGFGLMPSPV